MPRSVLSIGAGGVLAVLLQFNLSLTACGQEEKITVDQAPQVVLDAVKARFEGAKIIDAGKETEEGRPVFEITIDHKEQHIDVTLTPEGDILLIEREITRRGLPREVRRTLRRQYRGATYEIMEEIVEVEKKEEKLAYYEVLLTTQDDSSVEVQVNPEGKVIQVEKKAPGADND
jgi:uncharacterized membrane protein YkoI